MKYLTISLYLQLPISVVLCKGIINRRANRVFTPTEPMTLNTPIRKDLGNMVLRDVKDFQKQPKDEYHINPSSKQELDNMLAYSEHFVPNFSVDAVNLTSQHFEEIQARYAKKQTMRTTETQKNILRQWVDTEKQKNARKRAFNLMTQFVYGARYKLQYGQSLRSVYRDNLEYKIGYCFALMRDMKQQQLSLYSTMHFNLQQHYESYRSDGPVSYADFSSYLQLYEKIIRLDVDMMDIITIVKKFEEERMAIEATRPTDETTTDAAAAYEYDD